MSIRIGNPAPAFEAEAYVRGRNEAQRVSLAELRGVWVVLFFYPRDFTFICPTEIQALAALEEEFEKENAIVLAASTDSYECHKACYEADPRLEAVGFPVIADAAHRLSEAFGVLTEDGRALRATFVLDPEGILRHTQINDHDVGRSPEETLRILRALKTGQLCPVNWQPGEPTLTVRIPQLVG